MTVRPTATGTFGRTPLSNLLTYALDRALTGTLVIESAGARSAVALVNGIPTKVKTAEPVAWLGAVLVDLGFVDEETRARTAEEAMMERTLHGAVLLREGLLDADSLAEALAEQTALKLEWLATLPPETVYGYYDGVDYLRQYGASEPTIVEPLALIWRLVRQHAAPAAVDAALTRVGERPLRFHPTSKLSRFGFQAQEKAIIDVLRAKPHTYGQLLATDLAPEALLKRIVYVLTTCRQLDLGADTPPLGKSAAPADISEEPAHEIQPVPSVKPRVEAKAPTLQTPQEPEVQRISPEAEALKADIAARLEGIGSQTYYDILGVDTKAATAAISGAFFQLAKKYHPDRLGPEFSAVRPLAERVFARMTEAHQVLSNDEQRQDYDRLLKEGGATADEQEKVQRVLRAATAFQKAEVLVRRGNLSEAEKLAQTAHEEDPEQAEYGALYADILSQKPGDKDVRAIVALIDAAKKLQPDNAKVRLYRGRIMKRMGDARNSVREFEWVAERDPHNVEAAREVRLFRMRRGESKPEERKDKREKERDKERKEPKGGVLNQDISDIFGKWFKR